MELKDLREIEAQKLKLEIEALKAEKNRKENASKNNWLVCKMEFYRHLTPIILALAGFGYLYFNGNFENASNLIKARTINLEDREDALLASIDEKIALEIKAQDNFLILKDSLNYWLNQYDLLILKYEENTKTHKALLDKQRKEVLALKNRLNQNISSSEDGRPMEDLLTVEQRKIVPYSFNPAAVNDPTDITYIVPTRVRADILFRLLNLKDVIVDEEEYYSRNKIEPTTYLVLGDVLEFTIHE